jgi:hypothetical protein
VMNARIFRIIHVLKVEMGATQNGIQTHNCVWKKKEDETWARQGVRGDA